MGVVCSFFVVPTLVSVNGIETVEQELLNNPLTPLNNLLTYLGQCERGIETVEWDLITPGRKTQQFGSKVLIKGDGKVKEEGEKEGGRRRKEEEDEESDAHNQ